MSCLKKNRTQLHRAYRKLLTGLLCASAFIACPSLHAELVARLSSPQIDETQTLELTIRTDSRDVQGSPDLKPIANDFEILTTRTSSQYRVINGNVQAWTDWIIALRPLRTGTLDIPPLSYRGEQTKPLQLRVIPLDPELKKQMGNRVFFETSTEPEAPFVQAQVVFVRRLLYAEGTQIYGEMPDTPVVEDAVVIPLGNATSSQVTREDRRYGMIEQRYALFPERSGELKIPGATVSGSVRMNVNGRLRRNGVRVVAEPISLNVRPIPPEYPADTPWLPATRVDLVEAWDKSPPNFTLGEPLSQTLIVRADAATGSIIPPINYEIPNSHFRSYPEQPDIVDNQRGKGLIGTRSQTWSLIPTTAGEITLPMVELTWFDTQREEVRVSRLARRAIDVRTADGQPENTQALQERQSDDEPVTQATPDETLTAADRSVFSTGGAILLSLLLAAILWLGYPWLAARLNLPKLNRLHARHFKLPGAEQKRLKNQLNQSIASGSIKEIRRALAQLTTSSSVTRSSVNGWNEQALQRINALLSHAAYAPNPREPDRDALAAEVRVLFSSRERKAATATLPELYSS